MSYIIAVGEIEKGIWDATFEEERILIVEFSLALYIYFTSTNTSLVAG